jgi:hypothetical protein
VALQGLPGAGGGDVSLFRTAARRDANEAEIISALILCGAVVEQLREPVDLVVGFRGRIFLLEIKDGSKPPSKRALTERQSVFVPAWKAEGLPVAVVSSIEEALRAVGAVR